MAYKIAVASSDGTKIDEHFGSSVLFYIYNIEENGSYELIEKRNPLEERNDIVPFEKNMFTNHLDIQNQSCNNKSHDISGMKPRFQAVSDCRFVLCQRCGGFMEKELQKRGTSVFAIEIPLEKAIEKIHAYYTRTN